MLCGLERIGINSIGGKQMEMLFLLIGIVIGILTEKSIFNLKKNKLAWMKIIPFGIATCNTCGIKYVFSLYTARQSKIYKYGANDWECKKCEWL